MKNYAEILNIDSEAVVNLANVHQGYARAMRQTEEGQNSEYRASSLLLSALLTAIIAPSNSRERFISASSAYRELLNPYWQLLAVCGMDNKRFYQPKQTDDVDTNANSSFYNFIMNEFISVAMPSNLLKNTETKSSVRPVGRLHIPLNIYVEAFQSIKDFPTEDLSRQHLYSLEPVKLFLERASEKIRLQMEDLYHWRKLRGGIIPLEPEILASCVCFCLTIKQKRLSFFRIAKKINIDEIALIPLRIANDIVNPKISGG